MKRREFIRLLGGALAAQASPANAQELRVRTVGVLMGFANDAEALRRPEIDSSSNLVGACTGRSADLAPRRMRLTYSDARRNWSTACTPYDMRPPASAKYR